MLKYLDPHMTLIGQLWSCHIMHQSQMVTLKSPPEGQPQSANQSTDILPLFPSQTQNQQKFRECESRCQHCTVEAQTLQPTRFRLQTVILPEIHWGAFPKRFCSPQKSFSYRNQASTYGLQLISANSPHKCQLYQRVIPQMTMVRAPNQTRRHPRHFEYRRSGQSDADTTDTVRFNYRWWGTDIKKRLHAYTPSQNLYMFTNLADTIDTLKVYILLKQ